MSGLAEVSGAGRWLRAGVGWGPSPSTAWDASQPWRWPSHADLLLGGEWAALGTIFRARDLKTLSLEWQSWATSQVLDSALSSCTQMEFPWSAGARSYTHPPWGWHRAAHRSGGHSGSQPDGGPALLP